MGMTSAEFTAFSAEAGAAIDDLDAAIAAREAAEADVEASEEDLEAARGVEAEKRRVLTLLRQKFDANYRYDPDDVKPLIIFETPVDNANDVAVDAVAQVGWSKPMLEADIVNDGRFSWVNDEGSIIAMPTAVSQDVTGTLTTLEHDPFDFEGSGRHHLKVRGSVIHDRAGNVCREDYIQVNGFVG